MATMDLGRVIPLYKGDYSITEKYELNDIVSYNGSLYWHYSNEETLNIPPEETDIWEIILDITVTNEYINQKTAEMEEIATQASESAAAAEEAETAAIEAADRVEEAVEIAEGFGEYANNINGKTVFGQAVATERVEGGTKILNQFWMNDAVCNVGYYYEAEATKIWLYMVFSTPIATNGSFKTFLLRGPKNPETEEEITIDNAANTYEWSAPNYVFKLRSGISITPDEFGNYERDFRFARVYYDNDGNVTKCYYSAQYRFYLDNGVLRRRRFDGVEKTGANYITEIGLLKQTNSVANTFNAMCAPESSEAQKQVLPLVSSLQPVQYSFIIPDDYFTGATYGLSIVVRDGDGNIYMGPTFNKAEEPLADFEFPVTFTQSGLETTVTPNEFGAAIVAGRKPYALVTIPTGDEEPIIATINIRASTVSGVYAPVIDVFESPADGSICYVGAHWYPSNLDTPYGLELYTLLHN